MLNTAALDIVKRTTALEGFKPNDGGQVRFCTTKKHEIIVAGGNNSGKTYIGIVMCGWHIIPELDNMGHPTGRTIHPHLELRIPAAGREGWISSYSSDSQRDTLRPVIDKLLLPYIERAEYEDGVYKRLYFKGVDHQSWINMKWQKQGPRSYAGPKKSFVFMDEPHMIQIYQEVRARLFKSGGYMWNCLTPVVDADSPVASRDILWMRDRVVEPFHRHPEDFPLRDVIYIDVEENYDYMDGEFVDAMLSGMSAGEKAIRKSGLFILFTGRNAFNIDILSTCINYLESKDEESEPMYGDIVYSHDESDDEWKAQFIQNSRIDFPNKPQGEWTFKVWERHIDGDGLQICPGYLITCDAAEGKIGGDYTAAYVFRKDSKRIVAALHGHITEEQLAIQLWLLGHYYNDGGPDYEPAELAIEVRSYGAATQKYLIDGNSDLRIPKYPWHKLYSRPTASDMDQNLEYGVAPGWDTNARTRKYVITGAREAVLATYHSIQEEQLSKIPDIGFFVEAREFVQDKNGKYQGSTDDRVIACGIGYAIMGSDELHYDHTRMHEDPEPVDNGLWQVRINQDSNQAEIMMNSDFVTNQITNARSTTMNF